MKPLTTQTGPRDQKSKPKTIQTLIACQELSKIQTKNNLDVDTACQDLSFDQQPGADRIKQQQEVHTKQAGASTMRYDAVQLHRRLCTFFLEMMLWLTAW